MINVNNPNVRINSGNDRIIMIGRKNALKIPSNSDATINPPYVR